MPDAITSTVRLWLGRNSTITPATTLRHPVNTTTHPERVASGST